MNEFSCLHGNERYGACDDASTVITSIGFCPTKSRVERQNRRNRGHACFISFSADDCLTQSTFFTEGAPRAVICLSKPQAKSPTLMIFNSCGIDDIPPLRG